MFSSRTGFDLRPNRIAAAVARLRAEGAPLLDLTESNPTRVGLAYPEDLLGPLAQRAALDYDPAPFGLASARQAVSADFTRRGLAVPWERIFLSASTSEAYAFLFKLLADPGDDVLVPRPGYPLFEFLAALESVAIRGYDLVWDGSWQLDLAGLAAALGPRTRALVVVNPGNPTGSFLKPRELHGLQELCAERGLALVSDEVFADFPLDANDEHRTSAACDGPALTFALGGLSKSCALPQLKLAWGALCGPAPLVERALARLEVVADSYLSVSTPVQLALPELLSRREELQAPIRERLRSNLEQLRSRLAGTCATLLEPEGGWSAVLRVPATLGEEERVLRLLCEKRVLVHPGFFFDFPQEAFLVLSLLTPTATLGEALEILIADLEV